MNVIGFPACCGMALGSSLTMINKPQISRWYERGAFKERPDIDTIEKLFGYGLAHYYKRKRVTKFIYNISDQENYHQEPILRRMGFYDYAPPFISCRTYHKLQTLVLDCYPADEMGHAEDRYHELYSAKSIYNRD